MIGPSLLGLVRDGGGYVAASPPLRPEPVRDIRTFALQVPPDGSRLGELVALVTSGDIPPGSPACTLRRRRGRPRAGGPGGVRGGVVLVP
ncbi:hypothetical protein NKG94_14735 [Micromonospora sp. M12]